MLPVEQVEPVERSLGHEKVLGMGPGSAAMRTGPLVSILCLVLAVTPAAVLPLAQGDALACDPAGPDAGSGRDASTDDPVLLGDGTFAGCVGGPDPGDWYVLLLAAGDLITLSWSPGGGLHVGETVHTALESPAPGSVRVHAGVDGPFPFSLHSNDVVAYELTVTREHAPPVDLAITSMRHLTIIAADTDGPHHVYVTAVTIANDGPGDLLPSVGTEQLPPAVVRLSYVVDAPCADPAPFPCAWERTFATFELDSLAAGESKDLSVTWTERCTLGEVELRATALSHTTGEANPANDRLGWKVSLGAPVPGTHVPVPDLAALLPIFGPLAPLGALVGGSCGSTSPA